MTEPWHHRKSNRLAGYAYSTPGAYFLTICLQERRPLLGSVQSGAVVLSHAGAMAQRWWAALPRRFPTLELDAFVIMPDHMHGIVRLVDGECRTTSLTVSTAVQWFKTMTTNAYIRAVRCDGWPPFGGRLWQRGFHDRIVRDELSLAQLREYIACNPATSDLIVRGVNPEGAHIGSPL